MGAHVFVDESKERGLLVAAAFLPIPKVTPARRAVSRLVLPGQRRIHFHKEGNPRRHRILEVVTDLEAEVVIFDGSAYPNAKTARDACLTELINVIAKVGADRLVIERDESSVKSDQRLLYREVRSAGIAERLRYHHLKAHEESLLAIPDAVAWCWAKGGLWRRAVQRSVLEVRRV